jgi:uncharacterized protein
MPDTSAVSHDPATGRFEIRTDAGIALLAYLERGIILEITHTEVPEPVEGQGYAAALAEAALEYARRERKQVIPSCPYVAAFIERNPGYADLVSR